MSSLKFEVIFIGMFNSFCDSMSENRNTIYKKNTPRLFGMRDSSSVAPSAQRFFLIFALPCYKMLVYSFYNIFTQVIPGPPFAFGAILVLAAIIVATYIPESLNPLKSPTSKTGKRVVTRQMSGGSNTTLLTPLIPGEWATHQLSDFSPSIITQIIV